MARCLQYHVEHRRLFGTGLFSGGGPEKTTVKRRKTVASFDPRTKRTFSVEDFGEALPTKVTQNLRLTILTTTTLAVPLASLFAFFLTSK